MNRHLVLLAALTGCPDNTGITLWLAPKDQMETMVKLVTSEPPPF